MPRSIEHEILLRRNIGGYFFELANSRYFNSVACQGTRIASLCQETGYKPRVIRMKLLHDNEEITRLTVLANTRHMKANIDKVVTEDRLALFVANAFDIAEAAYNLTERQRKIFLARYPIEKLSDEFDLQADIKHAAFLAQPKRLIRRLLGNPVSV